MSTSSSLPNTTSCSFLPPTTPPPLPTPTMFGALFTPITVGDIKLEHRVAMAPLTRFRSVSSSHRLTCCTAY